MTTISPNYAGVNFRATEQVQPKKAAETNAQSKTESKGMSNAMKAGIGLAALSVAVIGGLAAKKHIDAKNFPKNFIKNFEKIYGKVENVGKEVTYEQVVTYIKEMQKKYPEAEKAFVMRLNEKGLKTVPFIKDKKIPESLLGANDGVCVMFKLPENRIIKGQSFIGETLDNDFKGIFGDRTSVLLD